MLVAVCTVQERPAAQPEVSQPTAEIVVGHCPAKYGKHSYSAYFVGGRTGTPSPHLFCGAWVTCCRG